MPEALLIQFARDDAGDQETGNDKEDIDADEAARQGLRGSRENSPPASRRWRADRRYPVDIAQTAGTNQANSCAASTPLAVPERPAISASPRQPRPGERLWKPDFRRQKDAAESRFCGASESASGRLEKHAKNPIYSITCCEILCARRNPSFMAQIVDSAPVLRR
jgi:hypothetical protein